MQTYKIVVSNLAKLDLQHIVSYITKSENVTTAKYVERSILSEIKRLKHFPAAYPKNGFASTDDVTVRFLIKWNYKILLRNRTSNRHIPYSAKSGKTNP
jgi:plasmid stabilization system protein ParE